MCEDMSFVPLKMLFLWTKTNGNNIPTSNICLR